MIRGDHNQCVIEIGHLSGHTDSFAELLRFLHCDAGEIVMMGHIDPCTFNEQKISFLLFLQMLDRHFRHFAERRLFVLQIIPFDVAVVFAMAVAEQTQKELAGFGDVEHASFIMNVLAFAFVHLHPFADQIASITSQTFQLFLI